MIDEGRRWQVQALAHAAHDVAGTAMDHRRTQYAKGAEDVLRYLLGEMTPTDGSVLDAIHERYHQRMSTLPEPELPGHEWQSGRLTGATTCSKCGLLPLDADDYATSCAADTVNQLTGKD